MIMDQLGYPQNEPTVMFEDNWACIYLSKNSVLYHKSKHIDVCVDHLWDLCNAGVTELVKVGTNDQVADGFTKLLPLPAFHKHHKVMMGLPKEHRDEGDE